MEEVVVDIREHPRSRAKVVNRAFEAFGIGAILGGGDGSVGRGYLEDDGGFLECQGRLSR